MNRQWRYLNWQWEKSYRRVKSMVFSQLYRNPNRDLCKSVLIAGTARSGTTWLADIVSAELRGRILFEPFNSRLVQAYSRFHYFQYMRPAEPNEALETFCRQVLTGAIRHKWIDRQVESLNAQYRVIKAIRANLLLKWIHERFPETPLILIVRHPCAVVLSRMQLGWDTDKDIEPLLAQPKLIEDFLQPYMDIIERARRDVEKHAIIWSVNNLVPLMQFKDSRLHLLFYEDLCTQLEVEMRRVFARINLSYQEETLTSSSRPSSTSLSTSAILTGADQLTRWCNELSAEQVMRILTIVEAFGLDYLYGDSIYPIAASSLSGLSGTD